MSTNPMVDALQKCPGMYSTTSDGVVAMAKMSVDATKLAVFGISEQSTFKAELGEAELSAIKADHPKDCASWEQFFEQLQSAFNHGRVNSTDGTSIECKMVDGGSLRFNLETSTENGQKLALDSLLNYHYIHIHSKEVERQLEETIRREQEIRHNAIELEREELSLKEVIERSKKQDAINQQRLAELQKELQQAEEEKRNAGDLDQVEEEDEELNLCRTRNPLGQRTSKDIDLENLKLLKGKWVTADNDEKAGTEQKYNSVVRPFTTSELANATQTFSSEQKGILWECFKRIDEWDFSVFEIQKCLTGDDYDSLAHQSQGGSLVYTAYALFFHTGIMTKFNIDERLLLNWLSVVEAGYHPNPYHNSMHAADVLHVTHYILRCGGMIKKCNLTSEDIFAAMFAATIHDYDHPGINNSFHIKAGTYLATLYNDRSILENRHVSNVFELMKLPKFNILSGVTDDQRRDIRDTVIEMVLATDMGLHAKFVQQFKRRLAENQEFVKKDDIRLALSMAVKMADISNCGRPTPLYLRWSEKISDEFYMQGDRERNLGMPCSPFMDRTAPAIAKGQIAFMNYIVVPLFECISEFVPDMHFSVDLTEQNKSYWMKNDDS